MASNQKIIARNFMRRGYSNSAPHQIASSGKMADYNTILVYSDIIIAERTGVNTVTIHPPCKGYLGSAISRARMAAEMYDREITVDAPARWETLEESLALRECCEQEFRHAVRVLSELVSIDHYLARLRRSAEDAVKRLDLDPLFNELDQANPEAASSTARYFLKRLGCYTSSAYDIAHNEDDTHRTRMLRELYDRVCENNALGTELLKLILGEGGNDD